MEIIIITLCIILGAGLLLAVLYLLAIRGRSGHPQLHTLKGRSYAHRGLHGQGIPENSMAAFRKARDAGYGVELDVHLLSDGNLAILHDSLLERTTGLPGRIEDLTTADLQNCRLEGTQETIPEFRKVLEMFGGKVPLVVELKPVGNNHAALCQATCRMMDSYQGIYCMESFDPRCLLWLKKHRPDILRGQLSEDHFKAKTKVPGIVKWLLTENLANFLTRPDFIAYRYRDRHRTLSNRLCPKGMGKVIWTVETPEEHQIALQEGWIPIFEGFLPEK